MIEYRETQIGNVIRSLPLMTIGPEITVVSFNMLGDVELVSECARLLYEQIRTLHFDYLVGPEVKTVPLLHELSRLFSINRYVVCRKKIHGYMVGPVSTLSNPLLVLNGKDAELISGKSVVLVDDVISTGKTIQIMMDLMSQCKANVLAVAAVAKQGEPNLLSSLPFHYLVTLPLMRNNKAA